MTIVALVVLVFVLLAGLLYVGWLYYNARQNHPVTAAGSLVVTGSAATALLGGPGGISPSMYLTLPG